MVGGGIQLADHGGDDWLEQTITDDDGGQAELEDFFIRYGDHEQTDGHDHCPGQNRTLEANQFIGDVPAENGTGINQRQIGAV